MVYQRTSAADIGSVEQFYMLRGPEEVAEFLRAQPVLVPLLLEAYPQIARHFGAGPEVVLEVVVDPEAVDDRQLFALILTGLPAEDALARLERLDREWWLGAMDKVQGSLCIDVEFARASIGRNTYGLPKSWRDTGRPPHPRKPGCARR